MKRLLLWSLGITAIMLLTLTACSKPDFTEKDAIKLGTAYKETQYNVKQENWTDEQDAVNERLKPFLTNARYEKLLLNREGYHSIYMANLLKSTISLRSVTFKPDENAEEDTLEFFYTLDFLITNENGKAEVEKTGQMGFKKENGAWKIYRDSDEKLLEKDFPSK